MQAANRRNRRTWGASKSAPAPKNGHPGSTGRINPATPMAIKVQPAICRIKARL